MKKIVRRTPWLVIGAAAFALRIVSTPVYGDDGVRTGERTIKIEQIKKDPTGVALLPFLVGFGSEAQYKIERSLRFRAGATAYLSRSVTAGNLKTMTLSMWVKRGTLTTALNQWLWGAMDDNQGLIFTTTDAIALYFSGTKYVQTSALFRDPSAWYHIVAVIDTRAAVAAANKLQIWVNGVRQAIGSSSNPTDDLTGVLNSTATHNIGRAANSTRYFDGYMADVYFIDGQALDANYFGSTDATTGAWMPKAYSGTYGTNGYYLPFNDPASTTTIGYDRQLGLTDSSKNNWTSSGISVTAGVTYDSFREVPTNWGTDTGAGGEVGANYCTLDPLDKNANLTLSNGNLTANPANTSDYYLARATMALPTTGKWIWSAKIDVRPLLCLMGLYSSDKPMNGEYSATGTAYQIEYGTAYSGTKFGSQSAPASWSGSPTPVDGDTFWWAYDAATGSVWVGLQVSGGTTISWINTSGTADPATGTDPRWTGIATGLFPGVLMPNPTTAYLHLNFGQRAWGVTNIPTGFKALCTHNLPAPAIPKPSNEFVAVTGAGSSNAIGTALAAARSGWSAYVDILKVLDTTGAWKWRFSYDASNEHSASTTDSYGSVANPSANNWVGYSIKLDGVAGIKAGSVSHTNGADTTVTHSSGVSARQLVLLFPRSGGDIPLYHPDLTSGKLLYLNTTAGEATLAKIKTVTSTSFKIDTGMATGTYDYLVIPETDGFFKLFAYTGNGATDGPFTWLGLRPAQAVFRRKDSSFDGELKDSKTSPYNPTGLNLYPHLADVSDAAGPMDFVSSGIKGRHSSTPNVSTALYVGWAFAESPFKTARAR